MENYSYSELIQRQARKYGGRTALRYRDDEKGRWEDLSWNRFAEIVLLAAKAMAQFGIGVQENIGIYSQNMPECLFTDFAAYANRAVTVPMYPTSSPAQVEYILRDAAISTLFVGEQQQYNNARIAQKACPALKQLVVFDARVKFDAGDHASVYFSDFLRLGDNMHSETLVKVRSKEALPEDAAVLIYTSGTTGDPKGVVLRHSNFMEAMRIHRERLPQVNDKETSFCFLPLTHIFEKAWTYLCLCSGVTIAINRDPKKILQTLPEVRPTMMCNVPRFWEKVYAGLHAKLSAFPAPLRVMAARAVKVGRRHNLAYRSKGLKPPLLLHLQFLFYDKTLFRFVKKVLGLERGILFPTAGAPLSDEVNLFLQSINIPIVYGYGLSETTATVSFCRRESFTLGSIGELMPGLEVKIDPSNNEILVKGRTVTDGYYHRPTENARSFTADGFFRTGDAGRLEGNTLFFIERIKDLYKTSNGKYVAPQAIEMLMTGDSLIAQIAVIGDCRKFVSALIVPNFGLLEHYANQKGLSYDSRQALVDLLEVQRLMESHVEERQKDLASFEKIKHFILLAEPFSLEGGELTDTLKLRRALILQKYAVRIETIYANA
ncbi:MAG: long-chain fatty acid--CoA ligase [Tannerella sp.]|jgi:long-chain acyl-CoA synthetase|nr:long-chain fatty acid--CoA ligase [Tannerella sp.]